MKKVQEIKSFVVILVLVVFFGNVFYVNAQNEKHSLSVYLTYNKIVGGESFLKISTSYKNEEGWQDATNIPFEIIKISESETKLGTGYTDGHGKARFVLPKGIIEAENTIEFRVTNHPVYEDTQESLFFKDLNLTADLKLNNETKQITATLLDLEGNPIVDEGLKFQVKRMFKGLGIGDGTYYTDENGMAVVDIEEDYNSFNGNLIFEVVLPEHDEYGTVTAQMNADFGISSKDLSTFDKRRLWSPANKTPLFYLIFPNIVLLFILGVFIYLLRNLARISKLGRQ